MKLRIACVVVGFLSLALSLAAQTASSASASAQVPPLLQFSNVATDEGGNTLSGTVNITFSLYTGQQGGEPLWTETQNNVQLDPTGHYSVQLGITKPNGVPTTLFTTGEARWLGVQIAQQPEQPRVLLLSVPYALKAGDAATIGGLPPSAFVLANPGQSATGAAATYSAEPASAPSAPPPTATDVTTTGGTINFLPIFNGTTTILDSVVFQSAASPFKVGINTTTPATTLDVKGAATIRGTLSLPTTGVATASKGANSQPFSLTASAFSSTTSTAVNQAFRWQAEPASNDSTSPSATLNLFFAEGTSAPAETGLSIASNGALTATSFSGNGSELTNVTAANASELGGLAPSAYQPAGSYATTTGSNTFTGSQTVTGNLTATGVVTGSNFQIGSNLFGYGSYANQNAFLGFAGNTTMTGIGNTATGVQALSTNATGDFNTAIGATALQVNTTGSDNTAAGASALFNNTTGTSNTAIGATALQLNTTGSYNTAAGVSALFNNTTGLQNTASGFNALSSNTTGAQNTASGFHALSSNTTGDGNAASGFNALTSNTTGNDNTASGEYALQLNTTGALNTAAGYNAGVTADGNPLAGANDTAVGANTAFGLDSISNATAIGSNAEVTVSNALVLGSISSVNNAANSTNVGIGTTAPLFSLDVHGTGNFTQAVTFGSPVTFASGQAFPGAITSVSGTSGITASTASGVVTLSLTPFSSCASGSALTAVPFTCTPLPFATLASNAFTGNQTVTGSVTATSFSGSGSGLTNITASNSNELGGLLPSAFAQLAASSNVFAGSVSAANLTATGTATAGTVTGGVVNATTYFEIGGTPFAYGSPFSLTAFLGFAGNTAFLSSLGKWDTGIGSEALKSDMSEGANTAVGNQALSQNTTGASNTAVGYTALEYNNGSSNTAIGAGAGSTIENTTFTGSGDTALGSGTSFGAGGPLSNATAIGSLAQVTANNAMVLGSINGYNSATADTFVGIGTTAPTNLLTLKGDITSPADTVLSITSPSIDGTWISLANTYDTGGRNWNIISAGPGDGEGDGALVFNNMENGTVVIDGNLTVNGNLVKSTGTFKIDHPLDPANKYLYHSFVESPDMMNVYNGNVVTNQRGVATVVLPDYFEALNRDFRYQLTVIGQFAQAIVARKIGHNRFVIRTSKPNVEVSWQVTGVRHDAYADAHPIQVEVEKTPQEQGRYMHPELFGAPAEQAIGYHAPAPPTRTHSASVLPETGEDDSHCIPASNPR